MKVFITASPFVGCKFYIVHDALNCVPVVLSYGVNGRLKIKYILSEAFVLVMCHSRVYLILFLFCVQHKFDSFCYFSLDICLESSFLLLVLCVWW